MNSKRTIWYGVAIIAAALLCLGACASQSPLGSQQGSVSVVSYYEATSGSVTSCSITLKITNTGTTKISTSTVSYSVKTGARTYDQTSAYTIGILPGKSVFVNPVVSYADSGEITSASDISITEYYFE